jgi:branched-chain amino acid transport system substrate-binding protein
MITRYAVSLVAWSATLLATQAAETLTIVSSLPRTGSANAQTTSMVNGIKMAIAEIDSKVTVGDTEYSIVYEDWDDASPERGAWDPAVEAANADKAIRDPNVMVYIGTYNSGAAKIAMPKLNQAGLAMISPANTWPGLTKPNVGEANEPSVYRPSGSISYFRVVPADDIQGAVGAMWAKELGAKRVFVLHDRELYGQGIAKMFQQSAEKLGLEVVGFEGIDGKSGNYKSLINKLRLQRPDLVYFGGTTETGAGQLAKDIASGGLSAKLMGPDAFYNSALITAGGNEALENRVFITFGGIPPEQQTGKGKAFVDAYRALYKSEPEGYAIYAYESAKVVIDAIKRAGKKDRAAILDALRATKDFDGALGTWSFDHNGDTTMNVMSGNTVRNGTFAFVKLLGQDTPPIIANATEPPAEAGNGPVAPPDTSAPPEAPPSAGFNLIGLVLLGAIVLSIIFVVMGSGNKSKNGKSD